MSKAKIQITPKEVAANKKGALQAFLNFFKLKK